MNAFRLAYNFAFKTKRRGLTVKAVFLAASARFRIYFYPGARLHRYLGTKGGESDSGEITDPQARADIYYVSDKVARVSRRVPWESKCLVQAMVAQRLLRSYGLASTLYLGVGRKEEDGGRMVAHAWVRCGPYSVCGGKGESYATVASFVM
jgi:hypothetical protein